MTSLVPKIAATTGSRTIAPRKSTLGRPGLAVHTLAKHELPALTLAGRRLTMPARYMNGKLRFPPLTPGICRSPGNAGHLRVEIALPYLKAPFAKPQLTPGKAGLMALARGPYLRRRLRGGYVDARRQIIAPSTGRQRPISSQRTFEFRHLDIRSGIVH